jgi:hypothetical protein
MSEIIKKSESLPVVQAPRGFEGGVAQEDLVIPRAKLLQALSPEVQENGMKQGLIINSLTKEVLPEKFIPIFSYKNYMRFNPRDKKSPNYNQNFEPGDVIWQSTDPEDPKVQAETAWGENGERPLATTFLNFFSYFPGVPMPLIISFKDTSYKAGKQLLSLCKFCGGDMFSREYKLTAKLEANNIAAYYVLSVAPVGPTAKENFTICEKWWSDFSMKRDKIQTHLDKDEVPY